MARKKKVAPTKERVSNSNLDFIHNGLSEALLGSPEANGSQLSQVDTLFQNNRWYLISNMRQILSEIYVEHGLIKTVIDIPVDDALRDPIIIQTSQLEPEQIEDLQSKIEEQDDINTAGQAMKWNRLFGGAGIIVINEDDYEVPLSIDSIKEEDRVSFRAVDMWELFSDKQYTGDQAANMAELNQNVEFYNYYGHKLHHSRVLLLKGLEAPSFIRPRLRGWGFSVVETLIRSINQYLKATDLTFEVLDEFKIDIYKIKGLTSTLMNPKGAAKVQERVALANRQKNYQNAITMDAEDDYAQKQLSFAGISETMEGIRKQVASDLRMPMSKIFGISSAGFSSGEDDIENYNSMVQGEVRAKVKFHILKMIKIRCQQMFGFIPDDLRIEFESLRMLSSEQEENVKSQKFARLLQAKQAGELTSEEFRDACNKDQLLSIDLENDKGILEELKEQKKDAIDKPVTKPAAVPASKTAPPVAKG